jgi:CheY-like chemotaxis protein
VKEPMDGLPTAGGATRCPQCGGEYDTAAVTFCGCVTPAPTPVCPRCGKCLCKLPPSQQQAFWAAAPATLYQRKADLRRIQSPEGSPSSGLRRPLVLVAEDDPVTLRIAQSAIERLGYGVLTARRGDEALATAQARLPDAVLTDALMPKLDGRKLCLALKQDPRTEHIKVAVMTALFTKGQNKSETMREFRADAFLKKPVDQEELQRVLADLVGPPEATS